MSACRWLPAAFTLACVQVMRVHDAHLSINIYIYVCMCTCMHIHVFICLFAYIHMYTYIHMHMRVFVDLSAAVQATCMVDATLFVGPACIAAQIHHSMM